MTRASKVVWVTGGGSGIGKAIVLTLAKAGAIVYASGRREDALEEVARQAQGLSGKVIALALDVADVAAVEGAARTIIAEAGAVDVLVNAAGNNIPDRSWSRISVDDWNFVNSVNADGAFYCIRAVLPGMRSRKQGLVVNISSWGGRFALKLTGPAYGASKRAMVSMTETLNMEEGDNGIRACVILPAAVNTEFLAKRSEGIPEAELTKMLQPDDIAALVRFIVEAPEHVCFNEILMSPRENYVYQTSS